VVEEECSGNGALAATLQGYPADAVIIPEPFPFIVTAQLGVLWLTVTVKGTPAHVLNTSAGVNAIDVAYNLYQSLLPLEEELNSPQARHPAYKDFAHPVNFNLGKFNGGDWASSVPAKATMDIRIGLYPGSKIPDLQKQIEDKFRSKINEKYSHAINYERDVSIVYSGFQAEGCEMDEKSDFIHQLKRVHEAVLGTPVLCQSITCTTDARFWQLYQNTPATCFGPEARNIHGIDESVSLESIRDVSRVLAVFISEWCGLEPI